MRMPGKLSLCAKMSEWVKREVRDIKGAAPVRATLIFYVFGDLPEKTHKQNGG